LVNPTRRISKDFDEWLEMQKRKSKGMYSKTKLTQILVQKFKNGEITFKPKKPKKPIDWDWRPDFEI